MSAQNTKVAGVAEALDAGWRPDPTGRYEWRYWDGGWTNRVASSRPAVKDAPAAPPTPAPSPMPSAPTTAPTPAPTPTAAAGAELAAPITIPDDSAEAGVPAAGPKASKAPKQKRTRLKPASLKPSRITKEQADAGAPKAESTGSPVVRTKTAVVGFFRSFVDEPESYHSERSVEIESDPRGERLVSTPTHYGRAWLVALSAFGVAVGSYLPWLSGTSAGIPFQQTGFEDGHGWAFTIGAFALVCAALLAMRVHPLRWVTIGIAVALAGLVFRDLVHVHDVVTTMNTSAAISADVGTGLWIMAGCSVVALIASVQLAERD